MQHAGSSPDFKFGAHLRKLKGKSASDPGLRGEKKPKTDMEDMPAAERGGSAGNRAGKASHPSGTTKADLHKVKGKVHRFEYEAKHGGHTVRVHYHGKKGKGGMMGYTPAEEHAHGDLKSAKSHVLSLMDNAEPEPAMDSGEMANSLG
jgi:hypothetical protein